jgi:oligopeptide/dipeptide ABC transporter ATP-binding protein
MTTLETLPGYNAAAPLLSVADLSVTFGSYEGQVAAVDGVSFTVRPGESLCIVGESGSGKSVTQMAVMGLLTSPPAHISGSVRYRGIELIGAPVSTLSAIRGTGVSMIFQDAITSLNPALKVGFQISEVFRARTGADSAAGRKHAIDLMERVAIPGASQRVNDYPFQFSGGMCQRIMIAMALALNPKVLIADEPTTALDVTVQRQVMELLTTLSKDADLALVLITHDLGVAAEQADNVMVMYAGRAVETGPTDPVFADPRHPYTQALLASMPEMSEVSTRLGIINGSPPVLSRLPQGCAFRPRCQHAAQMCQTSRPQLQAAGPGRASACLRMDDVFQRLGSNV